MLQVELINLQILFYFELCKSADRFELSSLGLLRLQMHVFPLYTFIIIIITCMYKIISLIHSPH